MLRWILQIFYVYYTLMHYMLAVWLSANVVRHAYVGPGYYLFL